MAKILIASSTTPFVQILAEQLSSKYAAHISCSGSDTVSALDNLNPDVLILSTSLPGTYPLAVLEQASKKPQVTIVLTDLITDRFVQQAAVLKVDTVIRIPCSTDYLIDRIDFFLSK